MTVFLDFEKPIAELEGKIDELRHLDSAGKVNIVAEITTLQKKADKLLNQTYSNLSPWQKVKVARHPERPQFFNYQEALFEEFTPLAGDRCFGEDQAIVGGLARFRGKPVMLIGQQKGQDTESRIRHNFGMARPEGYRKARRLMELADQFHLPLITFIDTNGAWPGIDAEERGQAEAIARSIEACLKVEVPLISIVIGEGGSGGAIAIGAANTVLMMEHAVYSVISPEGCASILWRSADMASDAAEAQRITAQDLYKLGIIDQIVPEPMGGAHRHPDVAIRSVGEALEHALLTLSAHEGRKLLQMRRDKFLGMGKKGL
ncbi:MAG: acetyl-CoA carboxylase carboxyltransferase subunit alpha [Alphaproteobacteria bacterium]|jgi:acetyl-CoA carboxylase carboxyl transferase subunit alpha|nr:acetyl-CoA carboxylase carboxyltransferase subunit alpha [Alphaproteobacteria bacterium]